MGKITRITYIYPHYKFILVQYERLKYFVIYEKKLIHLKSEITGNNVKIQSPLYSIVSRKFIYLKKTDKSIYPLIKILLLHFVPLNI